MSMFGGALKAPKATGTAVPEPEKTLGRFAVLHPDGTLAYSIDTSSAYRMVTIPMRFVTKEEAIAHAKKYPSPMTVVEMIDLGTTQTGFTYGSSIR